MKNILLIIGIIVIIIGAGFLIYKTILNYQELLKEKGVSLKNSETPEINVSPALEKKSILMVIAFKDFRDEEYFVPKQLFLVAGGDVKTASTQKGTAIGADGGTVPIDFLISDLNLAEFDAVVFIGGPGTLEYLDNEDSYKLVKDTVSQGKLLSAICISPIILAKAGVLEGKKATVWSSSMDKSAIKILEDNGVDYEDKPVVADGKIITGNGPAAAEEFGMKIIEVLTGL